MKGISLPRIWKVLVSFEVLVYLEYPNWLQQVVIKTLFGLMIISLYLDCDNQSLNELFSNNINIVQNNERQHLSGLLKADLVKNCIKS